MKPCRSDSVCELGHMTWPELAAGQRRVLVVPIGSLEQHGPHLPLSTDTIVAETIARRLCSARPNTVLAPPLAFTASGEHAGFAGTLSIGTDVTASTLVELVRSADWSAGVVFVNAHGGNADALADAQRRIDTETHNTETHNTETHTTLLWWPRIEGGDLHAGATETSLMLAIAPDLVRTELIVDGPSPPIDDLRRNGVKAISPSGVLGNPTRAAQAAGEHTLGLLVDDLIAAFDARFAAPSTSDTQ